MDRERKDNCDSVSQPEQVISLSTPSLTHDVGDLSKPSTNTTSAILVAENTHSDEQTVTSQPQPEVSQSKHDAESAAHSEQDTVDQTLLLCQNENHTVIRDSQTVDSIEQNVESQTNIHNSLTSSLDQNNPANYILDQMAICNIVTVQDSAQETKVEGTQSLSSASTDILSSPLRLDSNVNSTGPSGDAEVSFYDMKCEIDFIQIGAESVCPGKIKNDIPSESANNFLRDPASDAVSVEMSESRITASSLETYPAATTAALYEAAAAGSYHESVYYIKWVMFGQSNVPIITQNENGPCPLLAIMNVLLLKEKVKLAPMLEMITSEQLMTYLGECIFENIPQNLSATTQANYEQNMQDAMSVMYKLQTGLDVNVKFTGIGEFEYTRELIIFDLLEISLYHGWLVDPQDSETLSAISHCSYNQLVENIISLRQSEVENSVRQALIAEQFLERTASQLTYHGLCELSSLVKEKELCVFFRNNHFNTLYKYNNELFLLMTDQGFLTESNLVWQTLSNVDGDCHFTDATFRTYTKPVPSTVPITDPSLTVGSPEQIDHDYQVALFLQEEDASMQKQTWRSDLQQEQATHTFTDHELALRLQEEEDRKLSEETEKRASGLNILDPLSQQQQQRQVRPPSHGPSVEGQRRRVDRTDRRDKDDKGCSVL